MSEIDPLQKADIVIPKDLDDFCLQVATASVQRARCTSAREEFEQGLLEKLLEDAKAARDFEKIIKDLLMNE